METVTEDKKTASPLRRFLVGEFRTFDELGALLDEAAKAGLKCESIATGICTGVGGLHNSVVARLPGDGRRFKYAVEKFANIEELQIAVGKYGKRWTILSVITNLESLPDFWRDEKNAIVLEAEVVTSEGG